MTLTIRTEILLKISKDLFSMSMIGFQKNKKNLELKSILKIKNQRSQRDQQERKSLKLDFTRLIWRLLLDTRLKNKQKI